MPQPSRGSAAAAHGAIRGEHHPGFPAEGGARCRWLAPRLREPQQQQHGGRRQHGRQHECSRCAGPRDEGTSQCRPSGKCRASGKFEPTVGQRERVTRHERWHESRRSDAETYGMPNATPLRSARRIAGPGLRIASQATAEKVKIVSYSWATWSFKGIWLCISPVMFPAPLTVPVNSPLCVKVHARRTHLFRLRGRNNAINESSSLNPSNVRIAICRNTLQVLVTKGLRAR